MTLVWILAAVVVALAVVAGRRPGLARLAVRQATSRKGLSVLLIGGLMLGSTAITASIVAVDSAQRLATRIEQLRWGTTDVTVTSQRPFPVELADLITADPDVREATKGVAPQLELASTLADESSQRTEANANLIGFDPAHDAALGTYELTDGRRISSVRAGDIVLNERSAIRLAAHTGDTVTVTVGSTGESISLAVRGIARMRGKAAWGFDPLGFVQLPVAQKLARAPGAVNLLRVLAPNDPSAAVSALDAAMARSGLQLHARDAKREGLASARAQTAFLRYALVAMSAFMVIAGAMLIVNLVVMLAEERARQLAMLRALGMRRSSIVAIGALEGAGYALVAGGLGAGAGVAFGALLVRILQDAFQRFFFPGGSSLPFLFHANTTAVLSGFAGGALVALLAVTLAWRRASRLNVTAAMQGLTDVFPRAERRSWLVPAARVLALGVAIVAVSRPQAGVRLLAGVIALAIALSLMPRRLSSRTRMNVMGMAVLAWALGVAGTTDLGDPRAFMQVFVGVNAAAVFALSLLVAANIPVFERLAAGIGRFSSGARQTLRPVLAFLGQRPLRTGLTVGIFAFVLSLVTAASSVLASNPSREPDAASGFQIVATTEGPTPVDLRASHDVASATVVRSRRYHGPLSFPGGRIPSITTTVYEATPALANLALSERDPKLATDKAAWKEVLAGTRAIGSFGNPGEAIQFDASDVTVVSAGDLRAGRLLLGTIVGPDQFAAIVGPTVTTYLVRTKPGVVPATLVRSLEKTWFADRLDASTSRALLDQGQEDLRAFFAIARFLTRMALAIGVFSLAIIGLRAAVERRRMLGTLRVLGYRRASVTAALLAEAAMVTTAGMIAGTGSGLVLNRMFFRQGLGTIDLGLIAGTIAVTYAAALLAAVGPAIRASRVPPGEAVRATE